MLKKSLHYLIRCSFLLAIIICLNICFNSCNEKQEDYFSFLKKDQAYSIEVFKEGQIVLGCDLFLTYRDGKSDVLMNFTYPAALSTSNISIRFNTDGIKYFFAEEELESKNIPMLWKDVYELFLPEGDIVDNI